MSKKSLLFCVGMFFTALLCAQSGYTTVKTTKDEALAAFRNGKAHSELGETAIAIGYYESAIRKDPYFIDARLAIADAHVEMRDYFKAERLFEEALAMDTFYAPVAFYFLAKIEWQLDKYDEAAAHCASYLRQNPKNPLNRGNAERLQKSAHFAAWAKANPVPFELKSVGPGINSEKDEYLPSFTADGENMVFTRSTIKSERDDEDFYVSKKTDGVWSASTPFEGINSNENEGAQSISPDGTWLVFTACNREGDGSQGSCDIYWSQLKREGWTKPVPFSATINSEAWDSQPSIGADNKTLIFTSSRPGTRGKYDLWITEKGAGGKWKKPERLPPPVNTGGRDHTPFFHPDGQTLYFASDSLPGMGGDDLFMSRRNPDGTWGEPVNLGYPINSKANEAGLVVSLDGKTAYYATDRPGGKGGLDIYEFSLPENVRPKLANYAKVRVTNAQTGAPLVAKVDFIDLTTGQSYVVSTTKADGTSMICLPAGREYALNISKKKYLFYSANFNLTEAATFAEPFILNAALQPIGQDSSGGPTLPLERGKPVTLNNIFFETGSAVLLPRSTVELDALTNLLLESPTLKIQINGHTDDVGDAKSNLALSTARAKAVFDYLIGKKIAESRLRFKGFGETNPVVPNNTPEDRSLNRRTEFEIF
jgi:outer membrane protein OmpA-like peptidoglycan-associated protein